ncbi:anti-sigma factor [Amycolatopsis jiangsuensis]|uniref:Regulator of SigK n=1 Tax=Amycolatopsis jiangsuensis TaxID=1181879 RepID=A0A840J640_9PSEU|nr:anti-sigma factor [Amycolatopsis jiangsuensis]MBB4689075.1 anti-sigma-K factor RskA [Amycolatopsis jiangsuensis]
MSTADLHTLAGAYVLDAVTDRERAAFARHLDECLTCAHEVAEFRETAAVLGAAATDPVPDGLRARVVSAVTATRQLPPEVDAAPAFAERGPRSWRKRAGGGIAAVAAATALLAGGISIGMQENDSGTTQVAAPADVRSAPDATTVHADGAGGAAGATLSRRMGLVTVEVQRLPELAGGQAYQLWLIGPRGSQSAGLVHASEGTVSAALPPDTDRIAVTAEPATGSPQPTTAPILLLGLV